MKSTIPVILLLTLFTFAACKRSGKQPPNNLAWLDNFKDPMLDNVPDSLKYLIPILDTVLRTDQKYRSIADPGIYTKNRAEQQKLDSINILKITGILDKYGWLGIKEVGIVGQRAIDITMVHSSFAIKLKYYPLLIDAFRQNRVSGETVALYEDKLNAMMKRLQFYGTQVTFYKGKNLPFPIYEPEKVDARRRMLKMIPMKNYLAVFKAEWDSASYHSLLPALTKEKNIADTPSIHTDLQFIISQRAIDSMYKKR